MKEKEYVDKLISLARRKTFYRNKYPYNLGLVSPPKSTKEFKACNGNILKNYNPYEEVVQSFDCSNLVKALVNGYDINKMTVGYFQRTLSATGDCTEKKLLEQCTDISSDFSKLGNQCRLLYMSGHIGTYLGMEVDGKYNVVECTCGELGNGVCFSWVDKDGTRRTKKGGAKCKKSWSKHGLMTKWLSYAPQGSNSNEKPKVDYSKYPTLQMKIDPKTKAYLTRGEYVKIMQKLLKAKGCDPNGIDGIFGKDTKSALKKFQQTNTDINGNKLVVDCICGQKTWGSLYK